MMTSRYLGPEEHSFYYLSAIDPWIHAGEGQVELLLKFALLTSNQVLLSDNQAINCIGLQKLLHRHDFYNFISKEEPTEPPIVISMRADATNFKEVVERLIYGKEHPPIFPWLSKSKQLAVNELYGASDKPPSLQPFFDLAGGEFVNHITRLNKILETVGFVLSRTTDLAQSYPELVRAAAKRMIEASDLFGDDPNTADLISLASNTVLKSIDEGIEPTRSHLYRQLEKFSFPSQIRHFVRLRLLDEPYHNNFVSAHGLQMLTGPEIRQSAIGKFLPKVGTRLLSIHVEPLYQINEFPLSFEQVSFDCIRRIRRNSSFSDLLNVIRDSIETDGAEALRDLFLLIRSEMLNEPSIWRKVGTLRLSRVHQPSDLRQEWVKAGISLSDILSFAGKTSGFLAGETVGQLIGVFGIGGFVGAVTALVVENLIDRKIGIPKRKAEFQQLVQLLQPKRSLQSESVNDSSRKGEGSK